MRTMMLSVRVVATWVAFATAPTLLWLQAAEASRGYQSRACGFDMNRNGAIGECANHASGRLGDCPDCHVCDGTTRDPDGDGADENMIYVDCGSGGGDTSTCGSPSAPCRTVNYAVSSRARSGVQNIVCFKGTCGNEPSGGMGFGPDGLGTTYTRPKSGNEVRDFAYPKDPTMIVGWDADNDGDYPPHDTDDTAVLNGSGKLKAFDGAASGVPSYYELAHFSARDFGRDTGAEFEGFISFGRGQTNNVLLHDLVLTNILREIDSSNGRRVIDIMNSGAKSLALENILCQDCGAYFIRGEPGTTFGPFRFKNISWRMRAGPTTGPYGAKIWGAGDGFEWLDNVFDMSNGSGDFRGVCIDQNACTQDIDIVNNEFVNCTRGVVLQASTLGTGCGTRPVDKVRILRNVFRGTSQPARFNGIMHIYLHSVASSVSSSEYINNVTIANNFFSNTIQGTGGYTAAIYSTAARNGSPIPGTINILNNTFHGDWQGNYYPKAAIGISNEFNLSYPQKNYNIKSNVISGLSGGSPSRAFRVYYNAENLHADNNVYDPQATFIWDGGNDTGFGSWKSSVSEDANSWASCEPSYVSAGTGDLHLQPGDTCARSRGVDLSNLVALDIDGNDRPRGAAWDVGADQVLAGPAAPTLLEVVPLQ